MARCALRPPSGFRDGDDIPMRMSDTDLQLLMRYARQNAEDAFAEVVRIFVCRHVANLRGIEDHDIRLHAGTEDAAFGEVRAIGGLGRRLPHGLFE